MNNTTDPQRSKPALVELDIGTMELRAYQPSTGDLPQGAALSSSHNDYAEYLLHLVSTYPALKEQIKQTLLNLRADETDVDFYIEIAAETGAPSMIKANSQAGLKINAKWKA